MRRLLNEQVQESEKITISPQTGQKVGEYVVKWEYLTEDQVDGMVISRTEYACPTILLAFRLSLEPRRFQYCLPKWLARAWNRDPAYGAMFRPAS